MEEMKAQRLALKEKRAETMTKKKETEMAMFILTTPRTPSADEVVSELPPPEMAVMPEISADMLIPAALPAAEPIPAVTPLSPSDFMLEEDEYYDDCDDGLEESVEVIVQSPMVQNDFVVEEMIEEVDEEDYADEEGDEDEDEDEDDEDDDDEGDYAGSDGDE